MSAPEMRGARQPEPEPVRQVDEDTLCVTLDTGPRYCAARCTHRGGRLVHGKLDSARGLLVCPLHRSTFDLATGAVMGVANRSLWVGAEPREGER